MKIIKKISYSSIHPTAALTLLTLLILINISGCNQPLERIPLPNPAFDPATLEQLRTTHVTNMQQILQEKQLVSTSDQPSHFKTVDPYVPSTTLSTDACNANANCAYAKTQFPWLAPAFPANISVYNWWASRDITPDKAHVCGVKFDDDTTTRYQLKTFNNLAALEASPGFILTHYHACGSCSTLQDLAVYGELDLTKMGKVCAKRATLADKKACMQEIGFTESCAESWAYNAAKTGQSCAFICIKEYGLLPLLTGTENKPPVNPDGELNSCLLCDEMMAGPGFQYSASRTRRDSGIISEIDRPSDQVYSVPHHYFQ